MMKIKPENSCFYKQKTYAPWQLFLLKSLLLEPETLAEIETNLEFLTYFPPQPQIESVYPIRILEMLLDLAEDFGIGIKGQITEGALTYNDPNERLKIISEIENSNEPLYQKALKGGLDAKELRQLLNSDLKYRKDILDNKFTLYLKLHDSKKELTQLLNHFIDLFIKGKIVKHGRFLEHSSYTYDYQKASFLKNIPAYISQYGVSLDLKESTDFTLFGEDSTKVNFLETLLGLEKEGFITITQVSPINFDVPRSNKARQEIIVSLTVSEDLTQTSQLAKPDNEIFTWGELKIDLAKGTIQYKNGVAKEISPAQDEVKFLILLMQTNQIVKYSEIAKKLDMNCQMADPAEVARAVQYLRRNIVPILEDVGMTRKEIQSMIISKRNIGYKLRRSSSLS